MPLSRSRSRRSLTRVSERTNERTSRAFPRRRHRFPPCDSRATGHGRKNNKRRFADALYEVREYGVEGGGETLKRSLSIPRAAPVKFPDVRYSFLGATPRSRRAKQEEECSRNLAAAR